MSTREVIVSLGFTKPSDRRKPVRVVLAIQGSEASDSTRTIEFDEHEFALLMSGSVIQKIEEES